MTSNNNDPQNIRFSRRGLLKLGLTAGLGVSGVGLAGCSHASASDRSVDGVYVPMPPSDTPTNGNGINPMAFLREFDYGTVTREGGQTIRTYHLTATTTPIELNSVTTFTSWNYNGRVPGPTLRATEGDRVRVIFDNQGGRFHSIHFHGIHPEEVDGVRTIRHNESFVYEFDAEPYGVHLYHCHAEPVTRHLSRGLYGMFIVDPPEGRPPADEMVMIMASYDVDDDGKNEFFAINGIPNYYRRYRVPIYQNQLVRLYVLNAIEFDPVATFHIHANMFRLSRMGRQIEPEELTDVVTMGTAERHILEFSYPYTGKYMFHPHQDAIAEKGCMGFFEVLPSPA